MGRALTAQKSCTNVIIPFFLLTAKITELLTGLEPFCGEFLNFFSVRICNLELILGLQFSRKFHVTVNFFSWPDKTFSGRQLCNLRMTSLVFPSNISRVLEFTGRSLDCDGIDVFRVDFQRFRVQNPGPCILAYAFSAG
jgi:hypothetical protein